jgi:hypothetical protein
MRGRFRNPLVRGGQFIAVLFMTGCISASAAAQKVRMTSNPEVVKGCTFLGNVRATSRWEERRVPESLVITPTSRSGRGPRSSAGTRCSVVASGIHASGEAYRCADVPEARP